MIEFGELDLGELDHRIQPPEEADMQAELLQEVRDAWECMCESMERFTSAQARKEARARLDRARENASHPFF